jgi:hypothetical protein
MTQASDFRRLAAECRLYAARCSIPGHAAALIVSAEIYEMRAAEAEAAPISLIVRRERETPRRV